MERIDAHQHFWHPARGDYGWLPPDDPVLSRPYGPTDLAPLLQAAGIDRTVLVQAAPTVAETEYLLGIADATPWVAGVVGWVDLEGDLSDLHRLAPHPKLVGIRPMIQDIPDRDWMLRPDVRRGIEAVAEADLAFDALGFPIHIVNFLIILRATPELHCVLDHGLKPQIAAGSGGFDDWAAGMTRLAEQTDAAVKLSGLVTEAGPDWSVEDLRPYVDHLLKVFGPRRTMWGSDWPVVRLRCEYADWLTAAEALTSHLDDQDRARLFGGTAAEVYRLEETR
ncbi:hydrolase [Wenxinia marina]|uniref:Putative metal-dependent hydrolase of the TIM-barrel fold protein n=2 Tax=Wenxinia TaxID=653686 RepID=A0A0D0QBW5_9RHOB|nr:putative metal-dependent hydrolase of the TIM-barrel fold protein [Wenxinia marina DSM 24838]GGL61032.1 hydrolase [Wenxinia marina]